jgi:hypothetical protein
LKQTDEATGELRRLHDRELYDLYSSENANHAITQKMRRAELVACMLEKGAYRVLAERPDEKRPHE